MPSSRSFVRFSWGSKRILVRSERIMNQQPTQRVGHAASNRLQYCCVKCHGTHGPGKSSKTPDESPKCVNCRVIDQPANYLMCPNFIKVITREIAQKIGAFVSDQRNPIKLNLYWFRRSTMQQQSKLPDTDKNPPFQTLFFSVQTGIILTKVLHILPDVPQYKSLIISRNANFFSANALKSLEITIAPIKTKSVELTNRGPWF